MSQKPPANREEQAAISHARAYTAPGVTVFYDAGRCLHFAECVRGLPEAFDARKRPWIQPENASAEDVAEVVRRCPSGALRSRYDRTPFRHKPVGIVGASPGGAGTIRGQMVLRQILLHPPAYVMPEPQMLIPFSRQKFDAQTGDLLDEETRDRLRRFLEALVEWSERVGRPAATFERS